MTTRIRLYRLLGFSALAGLFFALPRRSRRRDVTIESAAWWDRRMALQRGDAE
jgi:hypothetical protein